MAIKRKEDTPAPGSPAWMSTYGDMVTLLLTFFIMLFAMSGSASSEVVKQVMMSMRNYTGNSGVLNKGNSYSANGVLLGSGVLPMPKYDVIISDQLLGTKEGELTAANKEAMEKLAKGIKDLLAGKVTKDTKEEITEELLEKLIGGKKLSDLISSETLEGSLDEFVEFSAKGKNLEELLGEKTIEELLGIKTL